MNIIHVIYIDIYINVSTYCAYGGFFAMDALYQIMEKKKLQLRENR